VTTAVHARGSTTSRRAGRWCARLAVAAGTLAFLVWRLGTGPFIDGLRRVEGGSLAAAAGIAVLTTVCCAWRWRIVARGLGVDLPLVTAVAAYYRSLFLNLTLPGGVVGDVHRGISHGRDTFDVGRALRAVAWERSAGQVVQVVLTVAVLLVVPSPVRAAMPLVALALLVAAAGVALWRARDPPPAGWAVPGRRGCAAPWPATCTTAARQAGVGRHRARVGAGRRGPRRHVPDRRTDRGGDSAPLPDAAAGADRAGGRGAAQRRRWGPREGVTAWAFAAAGLGASRGVATAVVYGVMVFVASLPGAAVLVGARGILARRDGAPDA